MKFWFFLFALLLVSVTKPATAGEPVERFEVAVRHEADFADAIADPDRKLVACPHRFAVTKDHDFGDKHLILWPEVLELLGGGTLRGSGPATFGVNTLSLSSQFGNLCLHWNRREKQIVR